MVSVKVAIIGVVAAAGIGVGAYSLGSASGAASPQGTPAAQEITATPLPTRAPGATAAPGSATAAALTLEEAKAVAVRAAPAPGRVIEWDEDHEPTGLRYDVTLLHDDGSTTDIEVDTVTGQITSMDHDNDGD